MHNAHVGNAAMQRKHGYRLVMFANRTDIGR